MISILAFTIVTLAIVQSSGPDDFKIGELTFHDTGVKAEHGFSVTTDNGIAVYDSEQQILYAFDQKSMTISSKQYDPGMDISGIEYHGRPVFRGRDGYHDTEGRLLESNVLLIRNRQIIGDIIYGVNWGKSDHILRMYNQKTGAIKGLGKVPKGFDPYYDVLFKFSVSGDDVFAAWYTHGKIFKLVDEENVEVKIRDEEFINSSDRLLKVEIPQRYAIEFIQGFFADSGKLYIFHLARDGYTLLVCDYKGAVLQKHTNSVNNLKNESNIERIYRVYFNKIDGAIFMYAVTQNEGCHGYYFAQINQEP